MEQLTRIITRLRNALADKEIQIDDSESAGAGEYDRLDSCKRKIDLLEGRIKNAISSADEQSPAVADFEQAASEIESAIARI